MIDLLYRQLFWFGNRGVKAKSIPTRVIPPCDPRADPDAVMALLADFGGLSQI